MRIQESAVKLVAEHELQRERRLDIRADSGFRPLYKAMAARQGDEAQAFRQRVEKMLQSLVEAILAAINGKNCQCHSGAAKEILPPVDPTRNDAERPVLRRTVIEQYRELERTSVAGNGRIRTCDGREIDCAFAISLQREEEGFRVREYEEAQLRDPLVLSFDGKACELTGGRLNFDLDADGRPELIPCLEGGSCFLVLDRNANGRVDDGRELFGVTTGNGFADLAVHDHDGNGWIDEADPVWGQLALWSGDGLSRLSEKGVGALYLGSVVSPFSLKASGGGLLGEIRAVGMYLMETGESGIMQQVDLALQGKAD